ncbi:MAG: serine/threonine-protein kinase [Vicinamibacterales bacterium]
MTSLSDAAVARLRTTATWPTCASGRYRFLEAIGRGGMGAVYRAQDDQLAREVAIKIPNGFGEAAVVQRLAVEARVLASLEHPGIVPIHDSGRLTDGRLFYVMKLVRGTTLRDHLATLPALGERLGVFERVCDPVAFAHARGFVHRDLKPENIMIGPFGEVLVMDWGAALLAPGTSPSGGDAGPAVVIGTAGFMAPEQASDRDVDTRADVYGLGALLFLLLTGEPPSHDTLERLDARRDVPAPLRAICARAMARRAADRYPDVVQLAQDVRRYRSGLAVDAHPETIVERLRRFARTYRTAILLVVAYLIMRVAVAVFAGR